MTFYPKYQDAMGHSHFGKSKLPFFIMKNLVSSSWPLHHHNLAELTLVVEGTGTEILNGNQQHFKRGTATIILPNHLHEIVVGQGPIYKYDCMFDTNVLFLSPTEHELGMAFMKTGVDFPSFYHLNEEQTVYLAGLLDQMLQEYESEHFGKETALRSKLLEAILFLTRIHYQQYADDSVSLDAKNCVQTILQHVHLHYQDDLTLASVCSELHWNSSYISRIFKQHMGQTFTHYVHQLRINRAIALLMSTTMSISDIALEVGFEHVRTFTRVFKEVRGIPPKQFREMIHTKQEPLASLSSS
ncbi:AraC family transcriptional regulator [Paenibacillus hodogayensis]|uniref:AraC family transcriptional regulator n=1 Tax=Paenibacillus hodogayensis TaxID=279208 RepID=A0ABV5VWE0_9BACL